jgi:uncharacterized repeat protein (TIGR01451 family)
VIDIGFLLQLSPRNHLRRIRNADSLCVQNAEREGIVLHSARALLFVVGVLFVVPAPLPAQNADLLLVKSDSPDPVVAGTNLSYVLTLTNSGPNDAISVNVSDTLPPDTTFVSMTQTSGAPFILSTPPVGEAGTVTATSTALPSGTSVSFSVIVKVNSGASRGIAIENIASVRSATNDPNGSNNFSTVTTRVNFSVDLSITKIDDPDPVQAGGDIVYTLAVTNAGPSLAQGITVFDFMPSGTTFVSLTAPAGWTVATPPVGTYGAVAMLRSFLDPADPPQIFTLVVNTGTVPPGSTITNEALITTPDQNDSDRGNDRVTETTAVVEANAASIPTIDEWALLLLALTLAGAGIGRLRIR